MTSEEQRRRRQEPGELARESAAAGTTGEQRARDVQRDEASGPGEQNARGGRTKRRRWRLIAVGVVAVCAVAGAAVASLALAGSSPTEEKPAAKEVPTVAVARGDIAVETRTQGTLAFEGQSTVSGGPTGTLTWLPDPDTVIAAGQPLYAVNTKPVMLLRGATPAWRDFGPGMSRGEDVRQLEENLHAFGVFSGEVDDEFTAKTEEAIRAWQKATRVPATGTLARTDILFLPAPVRLAEAKARLGQQVAEGTEMLAVSSTSKTVTVDLKPTQRALARPDASVTITLPSGKDVEGLVAHIDTPVERTGKDGASTTVVPVTVTVADQVTIAEFDRTGVQVLFSTANSTDVLTVPVEALVPLDDAAFGLETPDGSSTGVRRLPVAVGAFGAGRVEVSGDGVVEGLRVVVPSSVSGS